jgi:hypothetical protein
MLFGAGFSRLRSGGGAAYYVVATANPLVSSCATSPRIGEKLMALSASFSEEVDPVSFGRWFMGVTSLVL